MSPDRRTRLWLAGAAGAGLAIGIAGTTALGAAGPVSTGDRAAIERVVHDYILSHPEIITEALTKLQDRETGSRISAEAKALETPFAGAWAGAADGDVTLVMFTDYACGYCRASVADVDRLLAEDKRLKVVWREIPILGPASDAAAQAALAAAVQGKYPAFHRLIFKAGVPTAAKIAAAQKAAGVEPARAAADAKSAAVRSEIERNLALAQKLGVSGTPAFVIGDKMFGGAVGYDALKQAVADARKAG